MTEVLLGVLSAVLLGSVELLRQFVRSRVTPRQLATAGDIARMVVNAAETVGLDVDNMSGADKFHYASETLTLLARRLGLKLEPNEVDALIHAALAELREYQDSKQPAPAIPWLDFLGNQDDGNVPYEPADEDLESVSVVFDQGVPGQEAEVLPFPAPGGDQPSAN